MPTRNETVENIQDHDQSYEQIYIFFSATLSQKEIWNMDPICLNAEQMEKFW